MLHDLSIAGPNYFAVLHETWGAPITGLSEIRGPQTRG